MPKSQLSLKEGEFLIWYGKPDYRPRRVLFTIVLIGFISLAIAFLDLRGLIHGEDAQLIPALLLIGNLSLVFGYQGTSYYITSRRILKERDLLLFKRWKETPLETVTGVTVRRRSKRGFLSFRISEGGAVNFSLLSEDPDYVRQIAIDAKAKLNSAGS